MMEKEVNQLIIGRVAAIRERIEKATNRQSVASCISELIGLSNTPKISWSLIMEISLVLQRALERNNDIPATTPVMPPEEIQKVLSRAKKLANLADVDALLLLEANPNIGNKSRSTVWDSMCATAGRMQSGVSESRITGESCERAFAILFSHE